MSRWWLVVFVVGCGGGSHASSPDAAPPLPDGPPQCAATTVCAAIGWDVAQVPWIHVGLPQTALATTDLDGDGKRDLVIANGDAANGYGLKTRRGRGDGTYEDAVFDVGTTIPVGRILTAGPIVAWVPSAPSDSTGIFIGGPTVILGALAGVAMHAGALADATGDHVADLVGTVAASGGGFDLLVATGSGGGAFATPTKLDNLAHDVAVAVGDVTGDGVPDIVAVEVVTSAVLTDVHVYPGLAAGGFGARVDGTIVGPATRVQLADLDRDGKQDLVTETAALLATTGGAFAPQVSTGLVGAFAIADVTGDGIPDLVGTRLSLDLVVATGNGDATFAATHTSAFLTPPADLAIGDGPSVVATTSTVRVAALTILHDGSFVRQTPMPIAGADVLAADLDGDGRVDLVTGNLGPPTPTAVSIIHVGCDGTLGAPQQLDTSGSFGVGDVNGDGIPDVVDLEHAFLGGAPVATNIGADILQILAIGDFDHDGHADLLAEAGDGVNILTGDGTGVFEVQRIPLGFSAGNLKVAWGDLNGDGHLDIVATTPAGLAAFEDLPATTSTSLGTGPAYESRLVDVDGDGHLDIVAAALGNGGGGEIEVLHNRGDGTFDPWYGIGPGDEVAAANLDGHPAIVITNGADLERTTGHRGDIPVYLGPALDVAAIVDLTGDGRPDLVTRDANAHQLALYAATCR